MRPHYFDKELGEYIDPNKINMSPQPTEDERQSTLLTKQVSEHQSSSNKANTELSMSEDMLNKATQKMAAYNVQKDQIAGNKNLNDVERQTAFTVLNDANRMLDSTLEDAQKIYDADLDIAKKRNVSLQLSKKALDSHQRTVANTPTPQEVEEFKQMTRTGMDEAARVRIISTMGMDFYQSIPMV